MSRLGAVERRLATRSPVFGPTCDEIADALGAACSDPSHPEHAAALEFAGHISQLSPELFRAGLIGAAGLSDAAIRFSIRLLQGALSPDGANH